MFARRELIVALDYVRQHSVITGSGDAAERQTIYTTGLGCTQHGKLVSEKLGVKYVRQHMTPKLVLGSVDLNHRHRHHHHNHLFICS